MSRVRFGFAGAAALLLTAPALAQAPEPLSIVVFGPPSLGAFLPPVIKAQKLDEKNGLAIKFEERTPDAYTAQFNSGEFKLGGSASLMTVGLADTRGVKVTYLFNLFDFWGAVVTSRADVKTLKDLEGKEVATAKGTTAGVGCALSLRKDPPPPASAPRAPDIEEVLGQPEPAEDEGT